MRKGAGENTSFRKARKKECYAKVSFASGFNEKTFYCVDASSKILFALVSSS
jgi:hypothetical protein